MDNTSTKLNIGNKLRKYRNNKGYSQEYMADRLEISQKTYSNMENEKANITIDTLKKLATELDIDMLELLSDGKVVVQYNTSQDVSTFNGVVNQTVSEQIVSDYKVIIEEYKAIIKDLKNQLKAKNA